VYCFSIRFVSDELQQITKRDTERQYTTPMEAPAPAADELEQYRSAVTRYIRYLIRDATEADDLVQEAFIRAHQQRDSLRDPGALESWLYQIATHVSIDRMRQRAKTAERHVDEPVEDLAVPDSTQPSALTVIQQGEMSACVQRYVAKLSDTYKAVLLMCDADGISVKEVAELLQLPLTTVKMRLHRARQQMQVALKNACEFERDDRGVFVCEPKRPDR
jgi:RNA polymerase sigma-70 factor, ECF subfamily